MAEEETTEEVAKEGKSKKGGKMMLMIIIVLIVVLLIGGGLAAFLLLGSNDPVQANQPQQKQSAAQRNGGARRSTNLVTIGPMYTLDQFVVNLLSESGNKFLKTSLDIELSDESLSAEIDMKKSAIRDIMIRTLSSKTFEEVSTLKGKEKLKDEIVERVNEVLADGQIRNIFFTDFVVQ